jgi:hypothetical protein
VQRPKVERLHDLAHGPHMVRIPQALLKLAEFLRILTQGRLAKRDFLLRSPRWPP